MVFRILSLCLVLVILSLQNAVAQAVPQSLDIGETNQGYQKSVRFTRIQNDVQYYDPTKPAPDFETKEQPKPTRERTRSGAAEVNIPFALVTGLVLCVVVFLFLRFGASGGLVLRSDAKNPKRDTATRHKARSGSSLAGPSVENLLNNPDRQQALIGLAQQLIYRAVSANDLLLQRSWTARDVLRRMPKNSSYLPELSALVLKGELVHFGEREVSEEEFADFAARAKPLLQELSA